MAKNSGKDPFKTETLKAPTGVDAGDPYMLQHIQLTPADQRFLNRAMRLLVSVQAGTFVHRARREGYTPVEHRQGWSLWMLAAGAERPLDHWFAEEAAENPLQSGEQIRLLQEIDSFENTWFPRTRAIIRRLVPRDAREEFATIFFKNLEQQPMGPGVIGSVSSFLSRIDDLETTTLPHAKKVRATLEARGLTRAKLKDVRSLLEQATQLEIEPPPPKSRAGAILEAQATQFEALAALRDWFNDWATSLRTVFNVSEQIQLGLTQVKRATSPDEADDAEAVEVEEGEAPPAPPVPPAESKRPEVKKSTIKVKTV
jgi:hypothetical protein